MVIVALHLRLCENHLKILKETCKCCNSRIVVAIYTISISGIFQIHYLVSVLFEEEACFILLTQKQTSPIFINVITEVFYLQSITKQFFVTVKLKLKRKELFSLIQFLKEIQKQKNCSLAYNINTVHNIQRKVSYFSLLVYIYIITFISMERLKRKTNVYLNNLKQR